MVVAALRAAAGESTLESGTGRRTWSIEGRETQVLGALGQLHLESLAHVGKEIGWVTESASNYVTILVQAMMADVLEPPQSTLWPAGGTYSGSFTWQCATTPDHIYRHLIICCT